MTAHDGRPRSPEPAGKPEVVFTLWGWDRITLDGIHALSRAATLGDELHVGVVDDAAFPDRIASAPPIVAEDRVEIIARLRMVSDVVLVSGSDLADPEALRDELTRQSVTLVVAGLSALDDVQARAFETRLVRAAVDGGIRVRRVPGTECADL